MIDNFENWGKKARYVPTPIRLPLIIIPFAIAIYWSVVNEGLYYWFAKQQAQLFSGDYYVFLTFLLTLIVLLIPSAIIIRGLIPYFQKKNPDKNLSSRFDKDQIEKRKNNGDEII